MDAVEYLSELEEMKNLVECKKELLQECYEGATSISRDLTDTKVQTSKDNGQIEKYMTRAVDIEQGLEKIEVEYLEHRKKVVDQIDGLRDVRYVKLLYKIYLEYKTIMQTSEEMQMSYNYVRRLHMEALKAFEKKYAEEMAEWERDRE